MLTGFMGKRFRPVSGPLSLFTCVAAYGTERQKDRAGRTGIAGGQTLGVVRLIRRETTQS